VHFESGKSSGREAKQRIVDRLIPGQTVPCWVDPQRPDQSVLDRGLTGDIWFGLIPGAFFLFGVVGLYGSVRGRGLLAPGDEHGPPPETLVGPEARVLTPDLSRRARFIAFTCVALFWNGVMQVFVREVIHDWQAGRRPIFMTLCMLPFVGIGLALVVMALRQLLALWNPQLRLTLRPGRLVAGGRGQLDWELSGPLDRLGRLTLTLEGREQTRVRGNDRWSSSTFATLAILNEDLRLNTTRIGSARFDVPPDARPSARSPTSQIVWVVKAHGEMAGWVDLEDDFAVGVDPRESAGIDGL